MININGNYEAKKDAPLFGLKAGGYVCKIVNAVEKTSKKGNPMIELFLDVAEGDYADFYTKKFKADKESNPDAKWRCKAYIVIPDAGADEKNFLVRNFKNFIYAVESSNKGYALIANGGIDVVTLRGKAIGYTFGEEEYEKLDGSIGCTVKPNKAYAVVDITEGNFAVPKKKEVERKPEPPANDPWDDEEGELPF